MKMVTQMLKLFERDGQTGDWISFGMMTSQGDIVYDVDKDIYNIVDSFGYKDVTAEIIANVKCTERCMVLSELLIC